MRTIDEIKEYLEEHGYGEDEDSQVVLFKTPDYATAFIGMSDDGRAIYDYDLMVKDLMETEHLSALEAKEFVDFNVLGFSQTSRQPIVMFPCPKEG